MQALILESSLTSGGGGEGFQILNFTTPQQRKALASQLPRVFNDFNTAASQIVYGELNLVFTSWAMIDTRLALTFPLWETFLEPQRVVCIIVARDPADLIASVMGDTCIPDDDDLVTFFHIIIIKV